MNILRFIVAAVLMPLAVQLPPSVRAADQPAPAPKPLFDMSGTASLPASGVAPTSAQVTVTRSPDPAAPGLVVTIQPGKEGYPGLTLKPPGGPWNLSAFGRVEVRVVNTGTKSLTFCLRLDGDGNWQDNPWNAENLYLQPGKSGVVKVWFGRSFGKPGYALKPAAVVQALMFADKSSAAQSFRIESIEATGAPGEGPPVDPNSVRLVPTNGVLFGHGTSLDFAKQVECKNGAKASIAIEQGEPFGRQQLLWMSFPAGKPNASVVFKPAVGRWDLHDFLAVRVSVRNTSPVPAQLRLRLESNGGASDTVFATIATSKPFPSFTQTQITLPFASAIPWQGLKNGGNKTSWTGEPATGSHVTSDAVSALTITAEPANIAHDFHIESIQAVVPSAPELPAWLGQRPPVAGDWVKTFDDEFDGTALDETKWSATGENYYDKRSHYSRANVIVGGGVARLHYEKKRGFHNDDPKRNTTDYATGFLETRGKWTQRYGYFESRLKLPRAPGLWPAFWMMPDRGPAAKNRGSTGSGGMEFDIMEHLTRWGPFRYNIAMHWDDYGQDHKQTGTEKLYVQPDRDGFLTCGLLWTPGSAIYYCNGREVAHWDEPRISSVPSDLMFTLPSGGWDNSSLDDAQLPDDFIIDYVRVWQRKDLASEAEGRGR